MEWDENVKLRFAEATARIKKTKYPN